MRMPLSA